MDYCTTGIYYPEFVSIGFGNANFIHNIFSNCMPNKLIQLYLVLLGITGLYRGTFFKYMVSSSLYVRSFVLYRKYAIQSKTSTNILIKCTYIPTKFWTVHTCYPKNLFVWWDICYFATAQSFFNYLLWYRTLLILHQIYLNI